MQRHAALLMVTLLGACGGNTLDVGSQGGGEEGGVSGMGGRPPAGGYPGGKALGGAATYGGYSAGGSATGDVVGGSTTVGGGDVGGTPSSAGSTVATGGAPTLGGGTGFAGGVSLPPSTPIVPQTCGAGETQVWEGYTEDFFFRPLQKWVLNLLLSSDGHICGTATYVAKGEAPPPKATDPDADYPPGFDASTTGIDFVGPWPGVTYSIIEGAHRDQVMHIRVSARDLWSGWCQIQYPYPVAGGYAIMPQTAIVYDDTGNGCHYIDPLTLLSYEAGRMKCIDYWQVCSCTATGCAAQDTAPIVFDLQKKDDTTITGTVSDVTGTPTISLLRSL